MPAVLTSRGILGRPFDNDWVRGAGCGGAEALLLLQREEGPKLGLEPVAIHCANERHIKDHTRSTPIGVDKAYSSPAKTKGGRRQRWEAGAIPVQMLSDNEVAWRSPGTDAPLGSRSEALQWLAGAREGFALTPGR